MKNQALFSSKDKKNLKCGLLQFLFGTLRVNKGTGFGKTNKSTLSNI